MTEFIKTERRKKTFCFSWIFIVFYYKSFLLIFIDKLYLLSIEKRSMLECILDKTKQLTYCLIGPVRVRTWKHHPRKAGEAARAVVVLLLESLHCFHDIILSISSLPPCFPVPNVIFRFHSIFPSSYV